MNSGLGKVNVVIGVPKINTILDKKEYVEYVHNKVMESIYYEFLHIIDPKNSNELVGEPFNQKYNDGSNKKSGYHTQILEIEQFLSSNAKLLIEKLIRENKDVKEEISKNLSKYLIDINPSLNIPRAKKLFAKLLYYYYDEWELRNKA